MRARTIARMSGHAPFFQPGGTMDPAAASYIERQADTELLEALLARQYVFLLDSRQKGKSSMVARVLVRLRESGVRPVKLDLQRIGANVTPEQWYAGLLAAIAQELGLTSEAFTYWGQNQSIGPLARWIGALTEVILANTEEPVVIFVDEVDFVRALPFPTDEFFAGIRDCYNRRAEGKGFERLTFCIVGVATPGQLIRNPEITPFNIGKRIDLSDFTLEETESYTPALEFDGKDGRKLIARVHYWLNGHPYLTQLLCSYIAGEPSVRTPRDVDDMVRRLFLTPEARQREPNFSDVERRLLDPDVPGLSPEEKRTQVLELYGRVLKGKSVEVGEENPVVATLRLSGVGLENRRALRLRNRLYGIVFDEQWRRSSLPEAELRRQRGAARVAMLRTASVAGIVIVAVSTGAIEFLKLSNDRQTALKRLQRQSETLQHTSDERQSALMSLEVRNNDLTRVSGELERALADLKRQNEELSEITRQREHALAELQKNTSNLTYTTYLGQMAAASADIQISRITRLADLVEASKANPHRGWEWGHLAMRIGYGTHEEKFPKWSILEAQPAGNPLVVTPWDAYRIGSDRAKRVQTFPYRVYNAPAYRRGPYRIKHVEHPRGHEIDDARTGQTLVRSKIYSTIMDVDPTSGCYLLARDATLETVELRTIECDRLLMAYKGPDHAHAARFLPDGTILGTFQTSKDNVGEVRQWDRSGKTLSTAATDQQYPHAMALTPDRRYYAIYGHNNRVEIRAVADHHVVSSLQGMPRKVTAVEFSSDGRRVLTGCEDASVRLYETLSGQFLASLGGLRAAVRSVAFTDSKDGVAAIDSTGLLRVWRSLPKRWIDVILEPNFGPHDGAFAGDGKTLMLCSLQGEFMVRDVETRETRRAPFIKKGEDVTFKIFEGLPALFVGRANGQLDRIESSTLKKSVSAPIFREPFASIGRIPGRGLLVAGSASHKYAVIDAETLKVRHRIEPKLVRKAVDADGVDIEDRFAFDQETSQFAMFLGEVGRIQVYSAETGKMVADWKSDRAVRAMTFAQGGRELVVSFGAAWYVQDGETWVYDVRTGKRLHQFQHPGQTVGALEYAPKTHILAAGTRDRQETDRVVFLYDMRSRKEIAQIRQEPAVNLFSFSPDGERLLTWSIEFDGALWDSRTGQEVFQLPQKGIVAFVDGGRRIFQWGRAGTRVFSAIDWRKPAGNRLVSETNR